MRSERPTVDVVVPCYNYGRYLEGAVDAALDQPGVDVRVLIIDDHSTDDSSERAADLATRHPQVTFHRNAHNIGAVATFNVGIEWVSAPWFALVSSDDLLAPGSLLRACTVLADHPSVGLVHGDLVAFEDGRQPPRALQRQHDGLTVRVFDGAEWARRRCQAGENNIFSPEIVMRTEVQRAVGPYRADLPHTHDLYNWLCASALSDIARVRGVPHAFYRQHPQSHSFRQTQGRLANDLRERHAAFVAVVERGVFEHQGAEMLRLAERALADRAIDAANRSLDRGQPVETADELATVAVDLGRSQRPAVWGYRLRRMFRTAPQVTAILLIPGRIYRRVRDRRAYRRWLRDPE